MMMNRDDWWSRMLDYEDTRQCAICWRPLTAAGYKEPWWGCAKLGSDCGGWVHNECAGEGWRCKYKWCATDLNGVPLVKEEEDEEVKEEGKEEAKP